MPCVSVDGTPTPSGLSVLAAIRSGKTTPEEIAGAADMSLYRVRSGLRQLAQAGYVAESNGLFSLTSPGIAAL